jgi:Domain of unknown function (DUF6438)
MNRFVFVILITLFSKQVLANKIDSLKTDKDVVEFLKSVEENFRSNKYQAIQLKTSETIRQDLNCNGVADEWQVKNWEKTDFNHDGRTDLIIMLYWYDYGVYVVMDNGNNSFKLHTLSYNIFEKCELAKPVVVNGEQLLLFDEKKQIDTLIYKYSGFVEVNRRPSNYKIDSVEFRTGYCYGSCPVFTIKFDKDGHTEYDAGTYNPKEGKFFTTLQKDKLETILGLINYLSIRNLSNDYKVSWADDQTCWLRIRFADGTVKEIKDYGLKGTFGLRLIYSIFFDLRSNQDWK